MEDLRAGDAVSLSGEIYVARDAAHKRFMEALSSGEELPFPLKGATLYYMGPSPARPGRPIGSAGPTTAGRMDLYTPRLLDLGLKAMIGKGRRSPEVLEAIKQNRAIYFSAVGGAGALLSKSILSAETIAYADLGAEAVLRLKVEKFPVIVAIDSRGHNIYDIAPQTYTRSPKSPIE